MTGVSSGIPSGRHTRVTRGHAGPTYYTVFVLDLASRRVQILGSTPTPNALFMHQVARSLIVADEGLLAHHRILICDRDAKWSMAVKQLLTDAGLQVIQTPYQAPNANAYGERFIRSMKAECLDRIVVLGERHLRTTMADFVTHYHHERPHQGYGNRILQPRRSCTGTGRIRRHPRLGGLLNYYDRAA
jgi:putative transposase